MEPVVHFLPGLAVHEPLTQPAIARAWIATPLGRPITEAGFPAQNGKDPNA